MKARARIGQAVRRAMARSPRRRRHWTDEVGYKSPQEIALENAAKSLGVTLGEYYAEDLNLSDLPFGLEALEGGDVRIDASREELLVYVDGLRAKQRRRLRMRRLRIAGSIATLGFVVAAAVIGMTLSSGDENQRVLTKDARRGPGGRSVVSVLNAQSPFGTSVSSELSNGDGKIINSTYLNRYGDVCSALIEFREGISERDHAAGCVPPARIAAYLRSQPAFVVSIYTLVQGTVIRGYARTSVERIGGRSPWGQVEASVSPAWAPDGGDRAHPRPLKAFLVMARRRGGNRRTTGDPLRSTLDYRKYNLVAELRSGRVVPVGSPTPLGPERRDRLFDPIAMAFAGQRPRPQDENHRSK